MLLILASISKYKKNIKNKFWNTFGAFSIKDSSYVKLQPRFSARYLFDENWSINVIDECGVCGGRGKLQWYLNQDQDGYACYSNEFDCNCECYGTLLGTCIPFLGESD